MIRARLIAVTRPIDPALSPEALVEYCARVSNPKGQEEAKEPGRLLAYLIRNAHWSPLEMVHATVEVDCPRDIARQILRHRSFSFQEFSQRYAEAPGFCDREARRQDTTNRQNSIDDLPEGERAWWDEIQRVVREEAEFAYSAALSRGIAKECARVLLPEGLTMSRLYMAGSLRSFLHYLDVREGNGTQAEHQDVARAIRAALAPEFPTIFGGEVAA